MNAVRKVAVYGLALGIGLLVAATASAEQQAQKPQQAQQAPVVGDASVTSVNVEVMVLHATNPGGKQQIDPSIGKIDALTKLPFSAYSKITLISRTPYAVSRTAPTMATLPNDRVLQITLREILAQNRYRIAASINNPVGQQQRATTFLPLLEVTAPVGEPFFVAWQTYQGGTLVIGIKVLK
jgi:hypothetical protein